MQYLRFGKYSLPSVNEWMPICHTTMKCKLKLGFIDPILRFGTGFGCPEMENGTFTHHRLPSASLCSAIAFKQKGPAWSEVHNLFYCLQLVHKSVSNRLFPNYIDTGMEHQ